MQTAPCTGDDVTSRRIDLSLSSCSVKVNAAISVANAVVAAAHAASGLAWDSGLSEAARTLRAAEGAAIAAVALMNAAHSSSKDFKGSAFLFEA